MHLVHHDLSDLEPPGVLVAIEPVPRSCVQQWLAVNDRGELLLIETATKVVRCLGVLAESGFDPSKTVTLVPSPAGDLVAIAATRGSQGAVVDTRTSKVTMRLDRGDYRVNHSHFSVAFFEIAGRLLLVHATDWNRLDVSDPFTGELLTERQPTSYRQGEERPHHYLDYFHGSLCISPDGEWIADFGWVWHPDGAVRMWSLKRWLESNVWEAEDGLSSQLFGGFDFWDAPMCWVGKRCLAIWGIPDGDGDHTIPGVWLVDVEKETELPHLIGPLACRPSSARLKETWESGSDSPSGKILFDAFLFSFGKNSDFEVWDVLTRERIFKEENFLPLGYHPVAKTFLTQNQDGTLRLTKLVNEES
jgi:hypothetical protein